MTAKRLTKWAFVALLVLGLAFPVSNAFAGPVPATGKANAKVLQPIDLMPVKDLSFGTFAVMDTNPWLVDLSSPNPITGLSTTTMTANVTHFGGEMLGKMKVTGAPNQGFQVDPNPPSVITLTHNTDPTAKLKVIISTDSSNQLDATGFKEIYIRGTVSGDPMNPGVAPVTGMYMNTYSFTVQYN